MNPAEATALRPTPFSAMHRRNGARMAGFAGWDMPIQFGGILAEHRAVREKAGLFDISHMGQIWFSGPGAMESLQVLLTNDVHDLDPGRGRYSLLCREDGGVLDDLYVYALPEDRYLVVANASRVQADLDWFRTHALRGVVIEEQVQPAALALQGPAAEEILGGLSPEVRALKKNDVAEISICGREMVVARTGYTGEDGFELFGPAGHLLPLFLELERTGKPSGLAHAGLGARDTLRLEMGYRLYGHDLDEAHSALESGLGWAVRMDKAAFLGREALVQEKQRGSRRRLIGFRLAERGVPREGAAILFGGHEVGRVTSGTHSPSLGVGIGLGYVESALFPETAQGTSALAIELHGRPVPARAATPPFYRKEKGN